MIICILGLFTTFFVIALTFVLLFVVNLQPLTRQFIVGIVVSLLVSRILWIFESQLMYQLMLGYELDRTLILRKSEISILDIKCWKGFSHRVAVYSKSEEPTASMSNQVGGIGGIGGIGGGGGNELNTFPGLNQNHLMLKGLEKFAKLKNKEELNVEIDKLKEEIKLRQIELVCLENMIFASEQDSKSQSQSRKKSSHGVEPPPQQYESHVEPNLFDNFQAIPKVEDDHA